MKEYHVEVVSSSKNLEAVMNKMASDNWEVKNVMERTTNYDIIVTFERNKEI